MRIIYFLIFFTLFFWACKQETKTAAQETTLITDSATSLPVEDLVVYTFPDILKKTTEITQFPLGFEERFFADTLKYWAEEDKPQTDFLREKLLKPFFPNQAEQGAVIPVFRFQSGEQTILVFAELWAMPKGGAARVYLASLDAQNQPVEVVLLAKHDSFSIENPNGGTSAGYSIDSAFVLQPNLIRTFRQDEMAGTMDAYLKIEKGRFQLIGSAEVEELRQNPK